MAEKIFGPSIEDLRQDERLNAMIREVSKARAVAANYEGTADRQADREQMTRIAGILGDVLTQIRSMKRNG